MSAEQIADTTYDALMRLVRLKAKYGQLPLRKAEDLAANYARGREMVNRLEEITRGGQTISWPLSNRKLTVLMITTRDLTVGRVFL